MSNKLAKIETLESTTLHGPRAYVDLDLLTIKLRRASAMVSVLNTAAFADEAARLPAEALQDFTNDLATQMNEICEIVSTWTPAKT